MPVSTHQMAETDRLRIVLFNRPPTTTSIVNNMSTCLLVSSIITAAFTTMITIMLMFEFENNTEPTRIRRVVAWVPIFFFDFMVFEIVIGLVFWFAAGHAWQYVAVLGLLSGSLFMITAAIAVWMTLRASSYSCLGRQGETQSKD
ncbi:hypothetical protein LX32DRAFT_645472 [Colletotrichum zoysiae]|uniref:Uncharacterized protein n=1 Tax=Colletotrichum zoysiae TaxID=1216348 RepID=A0AAD9H6J1_9PEZI|nr:hypothetical protein LX32DRAFT_645472 [Colletotrichum zoysiae]